MVCGSLAWERRGADGGVRLVPVVIADVERPAFLGSVLYVDVRGLGGDEAGYRAAFEELPASLRGQRMPPPVSQGGTAGAAVVSDVGGLVVPRAGAAHGGAARGHPACGRGRGGVRLLGGEVAWARPAGVDRWLAGGLFELARTRRWATMAAAAVERSEARMRREPAGSAGVR